jgi:hypothetical protein
MYHQILRSTPLVTQVSALSEPILFFCAWLFAWFVYRCQGQLDQRAVMINLVPSNSEVNTSADHFQPCLSTLIPKNPRQGSHA